MAMNLRKLADMLGSEADAYVYLESLRWPTGPTCFHCTSDRVQLMNPRNGISRKTRTGAMSERRVWQCSDCRKQFSVLTGTMMHGTKIPVRTWVMVIFEMCCSKNGVAAREIERKYGLCSRTAWFLMHRIRNAMSNDSLLETMRGTIVADETFIGGSWKNKHHVKPTEPVPFRPGEVNPADRHGDKAVVLSLIDAETGEVRSRVIPDVTGHTLRKAISEQVDMPESVLYTDAHSGYKSLGREFARHEAVSHETGEYVRYKNGEVITSNLAENFFSQLKRSIDGTHHHVSKTHLPRYLDEFDFRYSTRKLNDAVRMERLMAQIDGTRITYKRVTG